MPFLPTTHVAVKSLDGKVFMQGAIKLGSNLSEGKIDTLVLVILHMWECFVSGQLRSSHFL